jgi:hypothetical protein
VEDFIVALENLFVRKEQMEKELSLAKEMGIDYLFNDINSKPNKRLKVDDK